LTDLVQIVVQRSWISGFRFGDLSDEQDPLLGTDTDRAFTIQGCPLGRRISHLPRFVRRHDKSPHVASRRNVTEACGTRVITHKTIDRRASKDREYPIGLSPLMAQDVIKLLRKLAAGGETPTNGIAEGS
jgi:hypothetical protein